MSDATTVGEVLQEFHEDFTKNRDERARTKIALFFGSLTHLATSDLVFETEDQIFAFKQALRIQLTAIREYEPNLDGGASATAAIGIATFLRTLLKP